MSVYDEPNVALFKSVIEGLSFGHFPLPIKLVVNAHGGLAIEITTVDRDAGTSTKIVKHTVIPTWFQRPSDIEAICHWTLNEVTSLIKHELEEFMTWEGRRLFDPHEPPANTAGMFPQEVLDDLMRTAFDGARQGKKV